MSEDIESKLQCLVTHENFGQLSRFSFVIDGPYFSQNYLLSILSEAGKQIAAKIAEENYTSVKDSLSSEKLQSEVTKEAARRIVDKWGRDHD